MKTPKSLLDAYETHAPLVTALRGAIRRMRPDIIDRDARRQFDALKKSNEAIRRLPPTEHRRILNEIRQEIEAARKLAAGVALHKVTPIPALAKEAREFAAAARRQTDFNFPAALDGVSADGLINLALLRGQLHPRLDAMTAAQLSEAYRAALKRQDAAGLVEAEIIESIVTNKGARLATSEEDRATAHALRSFMGKLMDLRIPEDMPEFDDLEQEIGQLMERADVVKVRAIDPTNQPAAALAFEQEQDAMTEAGEQSHADYVREAAKGSAS